MGSIHSISGFFRHAQSHCQIHQQAHFIRSGTVYTQTAYHLCPATGSYLINHIEIEIYETGLS